LGSIALIAWSGCSGESGKTEVSSASSGFKPAEEGQAKPAPALNTPSLPPAATTSQSAASPALPSQETTTTKESVPSLPKTPPLPTFDPNQVDPALAAKSYMKIEMTGSQDPKELVRFLSSVDRALQEMQGDAVRRFLNNDQVLDRGMAISRIKLTAAERLEKVATNPEEKSRALIAKLESLGQMAQFKDVPSADELRVVAKQLATNEDAKVATQALRMQLMSSVIDLQNQATTPETVLGLATSIIEKAENPDVALFTSLAQAAQALDSVAAQNENESNTAAADACNQLIDLLESRFRNAENPQLGMMAWRMKMQRLPDFESYLKVLDTRMAASANPAEVGAAARDLMNKVPSPFTAAALTQCATQFEYLGNTELAKNLFELAAEQIPTTRSEDLKKEIQSSIDGFRAKSESIGKPLPLDSLVDTQGAPLDPSRYTGKVVLVDFWATWCGPCVAEIPNIEKVYQKQHDQGFEVIAISLDEQRSDLDAFMEQKKLPWNVYVSGVPGKTGMDTPLARSLIINAIPFTMLIGRDGNVAAIHIRGQALEPKVTELLAAIPKSE
jgi:thiol-disulfide isomerase/thioredoxin